MTYLATYQLKQKKNVIVFNLKPTANANPNKA